MERGERKGSGLPAVALMWWEIRSPPRNEKNSRRGKKASHVSTLMSRRASQIVLTYSTCKYNTYFLTRSGPNRPAVG